MSNTSFQKKTLYASIITLIVGVILLTYPFFIAFAYEDYIYIDWFNDYNLGDLSSQGNWTSANWQVQDEKKWEGSKGIYCPNTATCTANKTGNLSTTGKYVIMVYITSAGNPKQGIQLEFKIGTTKKLEFRIEEVSGEMRVYGNTPSLAQIGTWTNFDSWQPVEVEWEDGSPDRWHYRWENEAWTDWYSGTITWSYFNRVDVNGSKVGNPNNGFVYVDTIDKEVQYICQLGTCDYCETYNTCVEAGCQWYYSEQAYLLFGRGGYCVEPQPPSEEDCGAFYKCQFCSEELCGIGELEGFCEWVDKGAGYGCYMVEPTIPPEQVVWEVPELEDCSELSGVEKWLCEIKNFVAGIFMPSQEKINVLWDTLGNFQQKFPFNYIMAIDRFFKDVSESLEEEKSIPIKIFGAEQNVDFSFWEKTGKVGGVVESIGSAIKDFTSIVLIIGFFTWLLMVIRRFWS